MGIIGDAFGKLFTTLRTFFTWLGTNILNGLQWVGQTIWDGLKWLGEQLGNFFMWLGGVLWDVIKWIAEVLGKLFEFLFDLLKDFFQVILDVIQGILYFLYMIGVVVAKVFLLFFEVAKLIWAFIVGLGRTFASLSYSGSGSGGNGYSEMIGRVFDVAAPLQINLVSYVIAFAIWVITAFQVIKLLSSTRVGGE